MSAAPARKTPCPCGSGKKYKNCCARRLQQAEPPWLDRAIKIKLIESVEDPEGALTALATFTKGSQAGRMFEGLAQAAAAAAKMAASNTTATPAKQRFKLCEDVTKEQAQLEKDWEALAMRLDEIAERLEKK
ncbi:MAG: SEC-C metal-binding domain-containing protein [Acidiferrobacteraceae bacterium]